MPTLDCTTVLIVDDAPSDAALIQAKLRNTTFGRFETEVVATYAEALEALARRHFDVILLDLLPEVDVTRDLAALQAKYPDLTLIVLTGAADDELGLRAIQAGAQDFLVKQLYHHQGVIRRVLYAVERQRLFVAAKNGD